MKTKLEQFNRSLQKAIVQILIKHVEEGASISISDVLTDPSFNSARVWLRTSREKVEWLNKNRQVVQGHLQEYMKLRNTPILQFLMEDGYVDKIDSLFEKIESTDENNIK